MGTNIRAIGEGSIALVCLAASKVLLLPPGRYLDALSIMDTYFHLVDWAGSYEEFAEKYDPCAFTFEQLTPKLLEFKKCTPKTN